MRIDILTVVPELLESPLSHSIPGRAVKKGLVEIHVHNLRKYGLGPRLTVDDYCYGGDAGMVMMVEPVFKMIEELKAERHYDEVIYMAPDGEILDQGIAKKVLTSASASIWLPAKSPWATSWSAAARFRPPSWPTASSA